MRFGNCQFNFSQFQQISIKISLFSARPFEKKMCQAALVVGMIILFISEHGNQYFSIYQALGTEHTCVCGTAWITGTSVSFFSG